MPFCVNCGQKLESEARVCPGCGLPIYSNNAQTHRQKVFEGNIHQCPNCGEAVKSFVPVCPTCGFEFRDVKSSSAVRVFADKLETLQAQKKNTSPISTVIRTFGFGRTEKTEEQIISLIRNFSVPNTKEDVFEFMILASSNINTTAISEPGENNTEEKKNMAARNDAWRAKMEQVYQKALLSFGSDPDFFRIQEIYSKTTNAITTAKKEKKKKTLLLLLPCFAALLIIFLINGLINISHSKKEHKLEQTVQEIQMDIINENYDAALLKAQTLYMDDNYSSESKDRWDKQREAIIKIIEQKMEEKG